MARLKDGEKRVQISFQRPEDVALFERLSAMAFERRYELPVFLILALHEAFPLPDKDAAGHPGLPAWPSNPQPAKGTDPGPVRRSLIAALVHQEMQSPSDPPAE